MKILTIVVSIITALLVGSQLICGLWMKSQGSVEASSISFHTTLGIASALFTLVTVVLAIIMAVRS